MQRIQVEPLFELGTEVIDHATQRLGTISKVWTRANKLSLTEYEIEVYYSVHREKGYNSFRAAEENLREIVYDEYGNAKVMPKGSSSSS